MGKHCCCCCCCCFDDALFALIKELSHNERKTNHRAVIPASRVERGRERHRDREEGGMDGRVGVNRSMSKILVPGAELCVDWSERSIH